MSAETIAELEEDLLEVIAELADDGLAGEEIAELLGSLGFETLAEIDDVFPFEILAEASSAQVQFETAYRQSMKRLLAADEAMARDIQRAMWQFRTEVLDVVQDSGTEFGAHRLKQMKEAIDRSRTTIQIRLEQTYDKFASENAALAIASVDNPLAKIGLRVDAVPVMIPQDHLAIMANNLPTLISDVTTEVAQKVQQTLTHQMLGGLTAPQARRKIAGFVGALPRQAARLEVPGNVFDAAENRAVQIMRTEGNRVFSTVATARIDDLSERIPGVGKVWMHSPGSSHAPRESHAALNGKLIFPARGEKFSVGGYAVAGPYDPKLPGSETINCHCKVRVAYDAEAQAASGQEQTSAGQTVRTAKPKVPKPKPAPAPSAPAGKLQWRECRTVREAENLAKELISRDLEKYPRHPYNPEHPLMIFRWRKATMVGKVSFGGLDVEAANAVTKALFEVADEAERLGIPAIRGVMMRCPAATASMGDGILAINGSEFMRLSRGAAASTAAQRAETTGRMVGKYLDDLEAQMLELRGTEGMTFSRGADRMLPDDVLAIVREAKEELAAGVKSGSVPYCVDTPEGFLWRGGRPIVVEATDAAGVTREIKISSPKRVNMFKGEKDPHVPTLCDRYVDAADRIRSTVWHEFGHHVHNVLQPAGGDGPVLSPAAYRLMQIKKEWRAVSSSIGYGGPNWEEQAVSVYGRTSPEEFFAECLSVWHTDDRRRVPQVWVDFARKWRVI